MRALYYTFIGLLWFAYFPVLCASEADSVKAIHGDTAGYSFHLRKPVSDQVLNYSGNLQTQTARLTAQNPLRVLVLDEQGNPVEGIRIQFKRLSFPEGGNNFRIEDTIACTDSRGIAQTNVVLGSVEGEYQVAARIKDFPSKEIEIFRVFARKSNWVFLLVAGLLGGLGLFLLGMGMMSDGMQNAAGDKMRAILSQLTHNRFVAIGVGSFITMAVQSSSATTVMLVSFVQSKLMKFRQTIGVILGAGIGTTITAQLIAFKLTDYSLLLIGIGFILNSFSNHGLWKNIGKTILGFGILFFGMHIMSDSMSPLRSFAPFLELLVSLENPILGILVGTLFTALIQSSAAFIGIMIIFATQGFLTLEASIPLLLGANIGTAITAILASIKTHREAKQVALAHTLFKVFGVLVFLFWIPQFADVVRFISPKPAEPSMTLNALAGVVPRQIANAHTVFNIMLTLIVVPFTNGFAWFVEKIIPLKAEEKPAFKTHYLDHGMIKSSSLALNLAKQEVIRIGRLVQDMTSDIIIPFLIKGEGIVDDIKTTEEEVNFLRDEVNNYILKITRENINEDRINEAFQLLYTIKEFEQMADIISTNLIPKAEVWCSRNYEFSEEGKKEIVDYHTRTQKQLSRAITVFAEVNLEKAKAMKQKYKQYRDMEFELEKQHFERLRDDVEESVTSSKTHVELMTNLRAINGHATNIARILLKWSK
ncbi:MAG: Na/Pi symporter [Bacteroidales bacterium]|jgi:phosphate:Na+ symporter|nr:Na/Pi symporter [Bacteroidales bacterium]